MATTRLIPVPKWPEHHDWPSVQGMRWLIFNERENGFDKVIRRLGRRVLIDEAAFFEWAETSSQPRKANRQKKSRAAA